MRISPLTETGCEELEWLAAAMQGNGLDIQITTTELAMALGVSQDTIKRRLNRERQAWADTADLIDDEPAEWDDTYLPRPEGDRWLTRSAEWDLVVVLRWLAQRPMKRQV